jgi:hypothetical protein
MTSVYVPKRDIINRTLKLGGQVVRSGTSIGANIQEAQETYNWLTIIKESNLIANEKIALLMEENVELIKILTAIVKNSKTR